MSSGGGVALAERHADVVDRVIAWEPALITALPHGDDLRTMVNGPNEAGSRVVPVS